jgi:hypothetical protein
MFSPDSRSFLKVFIVFLGFLSCGEVTALESTSEEEQILISHTPLSPSLSWRKKCAKHLWNLGGLSFGIQGGSLILRHVYPSSYFILTKIAQVTLPLKYLCWTLSKILNKETPAAENRAEWQQIFLALSIDTAFFFIFKSQDLHEVNKKLLAANKSLSDLLNAHVLHSRKFLGDMELKDMEIAHLKKRLAFVQGENKTF